MRGAKTIGAVLIAVLAISATAVSTASATLRACVTPGQTLHTTIAADMHSGPGKTYPVEQKVAKGMSVSAVESCPTKTVGKRPVYWYDVEFNGVAGWVDGRRLK